MTLTDQQQAELATGRVVVSVPCDPQPEFCENIDPEYSFWLYGENECYGQDVFFGNDAMGDHLNEVLGDDRAPIRIDDKIPTPAGDAIVRDVDVRLNEVWEWVVTLELEETCTRK